MHGGVRHFYSCTIAIKEYHNKVRLPTYVNFKSAAFVYDNRDNLK